MLLPGLCSSHITALVFFRSSKFLHSHQSKAILHDKQQNNVQSVRYNSSTSSQSLDLCLQLQPSLSDTLTLLAKYLT